MTPSEEWLWALPLDEISKAARLTKIPKELAACICYTESAGDRYATRFEAAFIHTLEVNHWAIENKITAHTEEIHQKTSWGYMQVMGAVARELGFCGQLTELLDPSLNIYYGCKKLSEHWVKYGGNISDVIAAYNYGHAKKKKSGMYANQLYVDKVHLLYRSLTKLQD